MFCFVYFFLVLSLQSDGLGIIYLKNMGFVGADAKQFCTTEILSCIYLELLTGRMGCQWCHIICVECRCNSFIVHFKHIDRHVSASMLNFCCCSSLIRTLSMIMSIPTGGQRQWQVAPQQLTESIANECSSFLQQHLQRLYLILIPPTYLSHLTASVKSLTPRIKVINCLTLVLFQPR